MSDCQEILKLYYNVLEKDIRRHHLTKQDIRIGIQNMKEAYRPKQSSLNSKMGSIVDYDDVANRCAYLHKYAPFHTAMVSELLTRACDVNWFVFSSLYSAKNSSLKLCSLGAGPGSDVIGVLAAVHSKFGLMSASATLVDCKSHWKDTFSALADELRLGEFGTLGQNFGPQFLDWTYLTSDLLGKMNANVNKAIASANLVTMVKFVSAAACQDTAAMIKKIFKSMKPGALVLYIDNAAGGFHQLLTTAAREMNFHSVFGPLHHEHYVNEAFAVKLFGYTSCYQTKVTIHLLQKEGGRETKAFSPVRPPSNRINHVQPNQYGTLPEILPKISPSSESTRANISFAAPSGTSKHSFVGLSAQNNERMRRQLSTSENLLTKSLEKDICRETDRHLVSENYNFRTEVSSSMQPSVAANKADTTIVARKFPSATLTRQNMSVKDTATNFPDYSTRNLIKDKTSNTKSDLTTHTELNASVSLKNASVPVVVSRSDWITTSTERHAVIRSENAFTLPPDLPQKSSSVSQIPQEKDCGCCVIL